MGTFLYFAFGSNLLKERLQLLNPSAVFKTIARLEDYKLCFDYSEVEKDLILLRSGWKGCPATVKSSPGSEVWGCLWQLSNEDSENLDKQEGVKGGTYKRIEIQVTDPSNCTYSCRTYQLLKTGMKDPKPSPQYLDIICRGAQQNGLPHEYQLMLQRTKDNGNVSPVAIYEQIIETLNKESRS